MKTYKELTKKETEVMSAALKACAAFKAETISEKQFLQRVKAYSFAAGEKQADNAKEAIILHFDAIELERTNEVVMPSKKQNKNTAMSVDTLYRGLNGCIKKYAQTLNGVNGEENMNKLVTSIKESSLKEKQSLRKIEYLKDAKNTFLELKDFWLSFPVMTLEDSKLIESDTLRPYLYTCKGYDYNHANNSDYFLNIVDAFLFSTLELHKETKVTTVDDALTAAKFRYNVLIASKSDKALQAFKDDNTKGKHEAEILGVLKSIDDIIESIEKKIFIDEVKRAKMKVAKLRAEFDFLNE